MCLQTYALKSCKGSSGEENRCPYIKCVDTKAILSCGQCNEFPCDRHMRPWQSTQSSTSTGKSKKWSKSSLGSILFPASFRVDWIETLFTHTWFESGCACQLFSPVGPSFWFVFCFQHTLLDPAFQGGQNQIHVAFNRN